MLSVILTAGFAFASWEETRTEGNAWRPEGEILLYSIVQGTYSDSSVSDAPSFVDVDLIHVAHDDFFRYNEWLSENGQKVVDAMKNAKSTLMKFTFKKAGEITYKLDGRKFAECYEAAKTIPVV